MNKKSYVSETKNLIKKWCWEKNNALNLFPDQLTCGSNKKVWWVCNKDKRHIFDAKICHVAEGRIVCPICANQRIIVGVNDLSTTNPELMNEWDFEKNEILPQQVTYGVNKKVWWKCNNGHEWQATIASRAGYQKTECPYCKNELKVSIPEKALAYYLSQYYQIEESKHFDWLNAMEIDIYIPQLNLGIEYDGKQWHRDTKRDLKKDNLCFQNKVKLIRIREEGCPDYISNVLFVRVKHNKDIVLQLKETIKNTFDLINNVFHTNLNTEPNIDKDYLNILNKTLSLLKDKSLAGSALIKEWNYEKNGDLNPEMLSLGMHKKVWWKCNNGHEWQALIYSRASGVNCPYCSNQKLLVGYNDLKTTFPTIAAEWDYKKNDLTPENVITGSNKKFWWKCSKCGYSWITSVSHRTFNSRGCPKCGRQKTISSHYKKIINLDNGKIYDSIKEAATDAHILPSSISQCCLGVHKTAGGYRWKYIE